MKEGKAGRTVVSCQIENSPCSFPLPKILLPPLTQNTASYQGEFWLGQQNGHKIHVFRQHIFLMKTAMCACVLHCELMYT